MAQRGVKLRAEAQKGAEIDWN